MKKQVRTTIILLAVLLVLFIVYLIASDDGYREVKLEAMPPRQPQTEEQQKQDEEALKYIRDDVIKVKADKATEFYNSILNSKYKENGDLVVIVSELPEFLKDVKKGQLFTCEGTELYPEGITIKVKKVEIHKNNSTARLTLERASDRDILNDWVLKKYGLLGTEDEEGTESEEPNKNNSSDSTDYDDTSSEDNIETE